MISEQFRIRGIDLEVKLDESLPHIKGNIYKFEQVILNLFSNARDAVIEMKNHSGKNFSMQVSINSYHNKENIYLTVEDNGIGIKKENLDKIMQPFFTTKKTGQGTGLGLSISYGIISEHGGKIEIKSKPLKGTTVLISLPIKQKREQHHSDK
jgi:signal transduction histidine kinase